jgi:glycosyltransferase involved in cell wall biosynthesis
MRSVLMINDSLIKGGRERRMLELIKGLLGNGNYKITLVILEDIVEYDYVHQLPIDFVIVARKSRFDLSAWSRLRKLVKEVKPDIIHSWSSLASFFLIPTLLTHKVKFINGIIADAPLNIGYTDKMFVRAKMTYPFSDIVISNSKAGIKSYDAPASKAVCVYNGIDFKRFDNLKDVHSLSIEVLGAPKEKFFTAGMVAAFQDRKDYGTLVDAAIELCREEATMRFLLVGKGELMNKYRKIVDEAGMEKQVLFLGARADVESLIQIFDVGVLMTNSTLHGEGVSNSIIEYMAGGVPVVASRGGGTDEVLDGNNGLLIDAFSKDQLKEKILYLKNNPARRKEMGNYAKTYACKHFNLANMTKEYVQLYDKLLN